MSLIENMGKVLGRIGLRESRKFFLDKEAWLAYQGKFFGYPKCCIDFFVNQWWHNPSPDYISRCHKAGFGFMGEGLNSRVPCEKCLQEQEKLAEGVL